MMRKKKTKKSQTFSLSVTLKSLEKEKQGKPITFGEILEAVEDKSFGLVLMLFALPSALPIPAAGYSTPFGIILATLGYQMLKGRHYPWFPKKVLSHELKSGFARKMIHTIEWVGEKVELFVKPRMTSLCSTIGHTVMGFFVIVMAGLMILPIPLTNTAPAMVIFLIGMGLSEEDGLLLLASFFVSLFAMGIYVFVLWVFFTYGVDGVLEIKDWIKGLF